MPINFTFIEITSTNIPRLGAMIPMEASTMRSGGQQISHWRWGCGEAAWRSLILRNAQNRQTGTTCRARMR